MGTDTEHDVQHRDRRHAFPVRQGNTDYTAILVKRPWNRHIVCPFAFEHWSEGESVILNAVRVLKNQSGVKNQNNGS